MRSATSLTWLILLVLAANNAVAAPSDRIPPRLVEPKRYFWHDLTYAFVTPNGPVTIVVQQSEFLKIETLAINYGNQQIMVDGSRFGFANVIDWGELFVSSSTKNGIASVTMTIPYRNSYSEGSSDLRFIYVTVRNGAVIDISHS